jgi:hypothetical protein
MASLLEAFGSATSLTLTSFNSLATSATAGWQSDVIDNGSSLYLDILVEVELAAVNTAPANSRAAFFYAYGIVDTAGSAYTSTGDGTPSGSVGTITFPDVTSLPIVAPLLGVLPYPVQNKAINAGPWSVARCFGGVVPKKVGIMCINHTGMTFAASGNAIKWIGVSRTVA